MKKILVVVDMQKDFVDGALGTAEAVAIVPDVVKKMNGHTGDIFVTYDTHFENYLETAEGKKLPIPHCIKGTEGWELDDRVAAALEGRAYHVVEKNTFGSTELPGMIKEACHGESFTIELIGLCTVICVISNALILKANFPETDISVDAYACAGVTPESHKAALTAMQMCQIAIEEGEVLC